MERYIPARLELDFPYHHEVEGLEEDLSDFETRVTLNNFKERDRWELEYGWQAIFYENTEGFLRNFSQKIMEKFDSTDAYRTTPEYQWELLAPNGEVYRRKGLDIFPEEFEAIIEGRDTGP